MNGERVRELLRAGGGYWSAKGADDRDKYTIRSRARDYDKRDFGSIVEVSVPFASEPYVEPLCIFRAIDAIARKSGFEHTIVEEHGDAPSLELFKNVMPQLSLDRADLEYIALFDTRVYHRMVTKK